MERYILVVDDEPAIRDVLEEALTLEGFRVRTASHGREALACMTQELPAAILLDLDMPVMNGWQLLQELRAQGVTVPIVFMSVGRPVREEASQHHADGYLAKPFELDDVMRVVRTMTGSGVPADD